MPVCWRGWCRWVWHILCLWRKNKQNTWLDSYILKQLINQKGCVFILPCFFPSLPSHSHADSRVHSHAWTQAVAASSSLPWLWRWNMQENLPQMLSRVFWHNRGSSVETRRKKKTISMPSGHVGIALSWFSCHLLHCPKLEFTLAAAVNRESDGWAWGLIQHNFSKKKQGFIATNEEWKLLKGLILTCAADFEPVEGAPSGGLEGKLHPNSEK